MTALVARKRQESLERALRDGATQLLAWWRSERAGNGDRAGLHPVTVAQLMLDVARRLEAHGCAPDCQERTECEQQGQVGHSLCGRKLCGCPKHHVCECRVADEIAKEGK